MKARESGMPNEAYWSQFFDAETAINLMLGQGGLTGDWVELGCGYGTFTLPLARRAQGTVTALDIDPEMIASVQRKANAIAMPHLVTEQRDFIVNGTGLGNESQAGVLIYNLLHLEQPVALLKEALRVLHIGGHLSVMHWRSDIPTPRGPSLDIRPRPEQCKAWMREAGFQGIRTIDISSACPFHFGLIAIR